MMDFTLNLPATSFAAIANGLLLIWLTTGIALYRRNRSVSTGDGGDKLLARRIRGHANAAEQVPIALILLALAELHGAGPMLTWGVAVALTVGRLAHAIQFWFRGAPFNLRPIGVVLTLLAEASAILWLAAFWTGVI
jgi:uncharacterized membrane protein YecN with MAPEG domain